MTTIEPLVERARAIVADWRAYIGIEESVKIGVQVGDLSEFVKENAAFVGPLPPNDTPLGFTMGSGDHTEFSVCIDPKAFADDNLEGVIVHELVHVHTFAQCETAEEREALEIATELAAQITMKHRSDLAALASALADKKTKERHAPVQGFSAGIPWDVHLRAYDAYCKKYTPQPALIDLEGRNCRGGFSTGELDDLIPGWRDELDERTKLRAERDAAMKAGERVRALGGSDVRCKACGSLGDRRCLAPEDVRAASMPATSAERTE